MVKRDLTHGSILKNLLLLSIPVIMTSLVQMVYNLTDIMWLGNIIDSDAVSSAGTAGFYMWFAASIIFLAKIGTEVKVAQSAGSNDIEGVKSYASNGLFSALIFGLLFSSIIIMFRKYLIGFFGIHDINVVADAEQYLFIVGFGMVFYILNPVFSGILSGIGNTLLPFLFNSIGLVVNMVLDPILINKYGVEGAAIATSIAQFTVSIIFIIYFLKVSKIFSRCNWISKVDINYMCIIFKLSIPVAIQSALFTFLAMIIARLLASWGPTPIAVQKVGSQIEALSWLTASGAQTALSAFMGQNLGANRWDRIKKGYKIAILTMGVYGLLINLLLFFGAEFLFSLFIKEQDVIPYGVEYLQILSLSQVFMVIEITTAGAFNGLGKTLPPSIVGIIFNALRIIGAIYLSANFGLVGIWWAISLSSVLKGIILLTWMAIYLSRRRSENEYLEKNKLIYE